MAMARSSRASPMSKLEMEMMVKILDQMDYDGNRSKYPNQNPRKNAILDKIIKCSQKTFRIVRTKDQLRKKWSELKTRQLDLLVDIRQSIKNKGRNNRASRVAGRDEMNNAAGSPIMEGSEDLEQEPQAFLDVTQEPQVSLGPAQGPQVSLGVTQIPQASLGGAQRPQTTLGGAERPQTSLGGAERPQASLGGAQRPQTSLGGAQRPQTSLGGAQRPQTSLGGAQRPHTSVDGAQRPHTSFGGAQRPQTSLGGARRPHTSLGGAQRPQTSLGCARRPHTSLGGAQRPQTSVSQKNPKKKNINHLCADCRLKVTKYGRDKCASCGGRGTGQANVSEREPPESAESLPSTSTGNVHIFSPTMQNGADLDQGPLGFLEVTQGPPSSLGVTQGPQTCLYDESLINQTLRIQINFMSQLKALVTEAEAQLIALQNE
ncbi:uncharacterized protein LOC143784637 [Ranitomeya variabilis]|uniref:uncharacterized protein LOC143784637 n=1 Tax=Ranitomeya variabilis TaxID=490064 RepID=UPI0040564AD0